MIPDNKIIRWLIKSNKIIKIIKLFKVIFKINLIQPQIQINLNKYLKIKQSKI